MATKTEVWDMLSERVKSKPDLKKLFAEDSNRAAKFSYNVGELHADFSKQLLDQEALAALRQLAALSGLNEKRAAFFAGEKINTSEDRAVLHPALRGSGTDNTRLQQVKDMQTRMAEFANQIIADGKYTAVVHIGIGGSDLGPRVLNDAFFGIGTPALTLRFAENIDGASIHDALLGLNPASTLVIIVSKSFGTQETLMNGEAAREWLGVHAGDNLIAVTANKDRAEAFGISPIQIFEFWDWVGGRYSLWSAVSLSLIICYGPQRFADLLEGANEMDNHFENAPLEENLPVMLALTQIWNRNFLGLPSQAIIPYARRLRKLPAFLQQLEMESNGKGATLDGGPVPYTCPVIWGDEGTNGQHAFFQMLHQGPDTIPVDFVAALDDGAKRPAHHRVLLANCIAQSEALMQGKSEQVVRAELVSAGMPADQIDRIAPQKTFAGNRPSTTIFLKSLNARALGNLLALYEHKVFVASVIWGINAFDQWGVELGKVLANHVLEDLNAQTPSTNHDGSTNALISLARNSLSD